MCLAIPGKIVDINKKQAVVDYENGTVIKAAILSGKFKKGDYVIVQGKIVIEKVPFAQVRKWKKFLVSGS